MIKRAVPCLSGRLVCFFLLCLIIPTCVVFAQETQVRVYRLNYAQPAALAEAVKVALSPRGSAVAHPPTNSVVVIDTPDRLTQIEQIIARMDVKAEEIVTEAQAQ